MTVERVAPPPDGDDAEADPYAIARLIAVRQLAAAPKTRLQLAQAMARRNVPEDVAVVVLDRFEELRLIDDAEYARMWVSSRQTHRGLSRSVLRRELRTKGVDPELIDEALSSIDADDEFEAATALAVRKLRSVGADDPQRRDRRVLAMLARRGYGGDMALRALRAALEQSSASVAADL